MPFTPWKKSVLKAILKMCLWRCLPEAHKKQEQMMLSQVQNYYISDAIFSQQMPI